MAIACGLLDNTFLNFWRHSIRYAAFGFTTKHNVRHREVLIAGSSDRSVSSPYLVFHLSKLQVQSPHDPQKNSGDY